MKTHKGCGTHSYFGAMIWLMSQAKSLCHPPKRVQVQLCGFLRLEYDGESGVMKRPNCEELYLAPKLSRPDSESRSLPVNLCGKGAY